MLDPKIEEQEQTGLDSLRHELSQLEQLQRRWMVGDDQPLKLDDFPQSWHPLLEQQDPDRFRILALALQSQYSAIQLQSPPSQSDFCDHADLPRLKFPCVNDALRPLVRRVLTATQKRSPEHLVMVLSLMLDRGYTAHPVDWLPTAQDDMLPEAYWPWYRWVMTQQSATETDSQHPESSELNAENWDQWYPAERVQRLRTLRALDPHRARELLQNCALREAAEKRLKLIQTLAFNLGESDSDYLKTLLNDRSQKVAQFAAQLLSRLGDDTVLEVLQAGADLARELADGYELVNRGVLKKRSQLKPRKLKNKTQRAIRSEQLTKISLVSLASALGSSIAELVTSWHFPENSAHDNRVFMQKAVSGLADDQLDALLDNLLNSAEEQTDFIGLLQLLLPRLSEEKRAQLCLELLQAPSTKLDFQDCLAFLAGPLSALDWNAMEKTTPWLNIVKQVKLDLEGAAYIDNTQLSYEFQALGLILPRKTAEAALETVKALGIRPSDPILDALRLNSRLKPSHSPE